MFRIILIAAAVLGGTAIYFIYTFIRQQRRVMRWQQARIKAEIETLENERRRIAANLHDEIGPILSAVKLQINHLEPSDETEHGLLEKSSDQIDQIIQRFRDISFDLYPNTLVRKGLIKGIEEFVYRIQSAHTPNIKLTATNITLTTDKEINIYRILQEIIHNTIKHAAASTLEIHLRETTDNLSIHTEDDGIGFVYEERMQTASGLGLLNIQSRIDVLGGKLSVEAQPGKGVKYSIEIPI